MNNKQYHQKTLKKFTKQSAIILLTALIFAFQSVFAQNAEDEISAAAQNCNASLAASYSKALSPIISGLQQNEVWREAVKAVVPVSCEINQPDWRLQMSFSLGHYALTAGVQSATVALMTRLTAAAPVGKDFYLGAAQLFDKITSAGATPAEASELIGAVVQSRLRVVQMEAFALVYLRDRNAGKEHAEALADANSQLPRIKRQNSGPRLMNEFSLPDNAWEQFKLSFVVSTPSRG